MRIATPMQNRRTRALAGVLAAALLAASCSNSSDDAEVEEETPTTEESTSTTDADADTDTEETSTTLRAADGAPLTGAPVPGDVDLNRPALVVKIDNHPTARPQAGLDAADIVVEMRVEGITRFAAAFHSQSPDPVGPVRSSRTSDFDILTGFDHPLYASSGGNDYVISGLRNLDIIEVTASSRTEYFRDGSRPAPHNLYVNTSELFALGEGSGPPAPWFSYRQDGESLPASAVEATGPVGITYRKGPVVTHTWDSDVGGWLRTQDGQPHTVASGDQIAPTNVVIMEASYVTSPADASSPELVSTGEGRAYVLTDGHIIEGRWSRPSATDKPALVDTEGEPIHLMGGSTWILYPEPGGVTLP